MLDDPCLPLTLALIPIEYIPNPELCIFYSKKYILIKIDYSFGKII